VVLSGADGDNKHPEADVQDLDVCHAVFDFTCLLITSIRKKAGASEQDDRGAATGMTESMKERAKEALVGRTGETDDEDD
jgi:hypothetical protein